MNLERLASGLFMVGFPGTEVDTEMASLVDEGVAGAILFKRNISTPAQVAALTNALKTRAGRPFLLAVDQEGGRVARLRGAPFTELPPMRTVGKSLDAALAARVGKLLAYEVRSVGFDWTFAPVLDVDTRPDNPVIADRSLHSDAAEVARLGVALSQALEAEGVASCAKHFPGHGDTSQDSHLALPRLPHDMERLRAVELKPFAAYSSARLASVMTAHVIFEAIDQSVPATMSRAVLDGLLRGELGFEGVIVSDDLEMKAIAEHFNVERAVVEGLEAGVDLFLVCHTPSVQRRAILAVVNAVKAGRLTTKRLEESTARLETLSRRFARPREELLSRLGSDEHRALAKGLEAEHFTGRDPTER